MKNVLIIYTGGTIGMTRTENGYAPQSGQFRRAMEAIPDLYAEQMPRWDMLEMDPLLDSSNMTVHEWNKIAQLVADHYDAYDGFVVLHGTDTMAYTASALSLMLEGLAKPVMSYRLADPHVRDPQRRARQSHHLAAHRGRGGGA